MRRGLHTATLLALFLLIGVLPATHAQETGASRSEVVDTLRQQAEAMTEDRRAFYDALDWRAIKEEVQSLDFGALQDRFQRSEALPNASMAEVGPPAPVGGPSGFSGPVPEPDLNAKASSGSGNHLCRPLKLPEDFAPAIEAGQSFDLKAGMPSTEVLQTLGPPTQSSWCLGCPLWRYGDRLLAFDTTGRLRFWQGGEIPTRSPHTATLREEGILREGMNKQEVIELLGHPPTSAMPHDYWRYGNLHLFFSSLTGKLGDIFYWD